MRRQQQSGFTYLMVLFAVAFMGVVLAAAGETWQSVRQREREVELLFVGNAFRHAIGGYYDGTPGPAKRFPRSLEELLKDPRYLATRRYLRKIYVDPVTGKSEWGLVKAPDGGIIGVHSLSAAAPIKRENFPAGLEAFAAAKQYADWKFVYAPGSGAAASGARAGTSGPFTTPSPVAPSPNTPTPAFGAPGAMTPSGPLAPLSPPQTP